jgi:hypothetical protein
MGEQDFRASEDRYSFGVGKFEQAQVIVPQRPYDVFSGFGYVVESAAEGAGHARQAFFSVSVKDTAHHVPFSLLEAAVTHARRNSSGGFHSRISFDFAETSDDRVMAIHTRSKRSGELRGEP